MLAPSWPQVGPKSEKDLQKSVRGPPWTPNLEPFWAVLGPCWGQCWQLLPASWHSQGHVTQHKPKMAKDSPKMPQHCPQVSDFRAMLAGLGVPEHCKN